MKHFKTYLLCLGLALTTASCSQDDFDSTEATSEKLVDMSFIAGSSQPVTRTVLGSDGSTVTWQTNDQIGIGYKTASYQKTYPFKTPTTGSDVRFWGKAADQTNPYFMMYPYQENAKIAVKSNTQAEYQYDFPKNQKAVAGSFDPKANVSVGIIPQRGKPFIAYNVGGLLRFTIKGTSNVKQVKLIAVGQENLAGKLSSTITFANDGKISSIKNQFNEASPVVNLTAESGTFEQNKAYYIALPEQKLSQGLTLVFIMQDGKAILKKVKQEVNIQRAKVYNLGEMTLDPTKAKDFILKNQPIIDAVAAKVSGLNRKPDGNLDIYDGDNLEKILSYKGILTITDNDKLTSIDELQYYRNITSVSLERNKNLAGELDFNKNPYLNNSIVVSKSPLVTKIDISGLKDLKFLSAHQLDGLTEAKVGNNPQMTMLALYNNKLLTKIDASNLPALTILQAYNNGELTNINTLNSPKINYIDISATGKLTQIEGLSDKDQLENFTAWGNKIESYDFSKMTKLKSINLIGSAVKEIKGLAAAGTNLKKLELGSTQISSLDVTQNTELQKLNLSFVKGITTLDLSNNTHLTELTTNNSGIRELKLGSKNGLKNINVSSSNLSSLDISEAGTIENITVGLQTDATGKDQQIKVTMTQQQKDYFDSKGITFTENKISDNNDKNKPNSNVKVIIKQ
nr:fimbrillin family protein [uncultured Prevotella sp.]